MRKLVCVTHTQKKDVKLRIPIEHSIHQTTRVCAVWTEGIVNAFSENIIHQRILENEKLKATKSTQIKKASASLGDRLLSILNEHLISRLGRYHLQKTKRTVKY